MITIYPTFWLDIPFGSPDLNVYQDIERFLYSQTCLHVKHIAQRFLYVKNDSFVKDEYVIDIIFNDPKYETLFRLKYPEFIVHFNPS